MAGVAEPQGWRISQHCIRPRPIPLAAALNLGRICGYEPRPASATGTLSCAADPVNHQVVGLTMEPSQRPSGVPQLREVFVWLALGLFFAGYPLAWILFSPKSVLRSSDAEFVHGFGAGVGMTFGAILGVFLLGVAWSRYARRHSSRNRRRVEVALMVGFIITVLFVTAAVRPAH